MKSQQGKEGKFNQSSNKQSILSALNTITTLTRIYKSVVNGFSGEYVVYCEMQSSSSSCDYKIERLKLSYFKAFPNSLLDKFARTVRVVVTTLTESESAF